MSGALDRIFSEITQFSKAMGGLHNSFLDIVRRDVNRFLEQTNHLVHQMHWQAWTTIGLTTLNTSLSIAGALIPKTMTSDPQASANSLNLRLNARNFSDKTQETLKWLGEKLSNNDFLRSTCKTSAKFINGVTPACDLWFRSAITETESKRALLERVNVQDGQAKKTIFDQQIQQAQSAVLRILESKSKGG